VQLTHLANTHGGHTRVSFHVKPLAYFWIESALDLVIEGVAEIASLFNVSSILPLAFGVHLDV
jgi:hypothetical protein